MSTTLVTDVNVFDGKNEKLIEKANVLVEGNMIKQVSTGKVETGGATVIDGGGRTLIPGLIDAHWHTMFNFWPISKMLNADFGLHSIAAGQSARNTLLRGFTSVRDAGGNCFGVKRATDAGLVDGPRIYPSGAAITQTSGHFDFRGPNDVPSNPDTPLDYLQRVGHMMIADGVPEVTKRTREALRMGASQIKAVAGGGVTSAYDPLDVTEYTFDEMKAIVDVAKTWNTYVAIHANTDVAIRQSLEAGILSVEHGFLMGEPTVKLMAQEGAWFSMQPLLDDEDAIKFEDPISTAKWVQVTDGTDKVIRLAKAHGVKIAFGTDTLFSPELAKKQGKMLTKLIRWFTPSKL